MICWLLINIGQIVAYYLHLLIVYVEHSFLRIFLSLIAALCCRPASLQTSLCACPWCFGESWCHYWGTGGLTISLSFLAFLSNVLTVLHLLAQWFLRRFVCKICWAWYLSGIWALALSVLGMHFHGRVWWRSRQIPDLGCYLHMRWVLGLCWLARTTNSKRSCCWSARVLVAWAYLLGL